MTQTAKRDDGERVTADMMRERWGLTVKAEFVPFSKSRNAAENIGKRGVNHMSLNWRVTLQRDGRDILTTDYSAGIAHCPSYVNRLRSRFTLDEAEAISFECEHGKRAHVSPVLGTIPRGKNLEPCAAEVLYSLVMDAGVLDYPTYEEWAREYGYDEDSRKGEATYRACMEIALKLRAGVGERVLSEMQEAFQDF